MTTVAHPRGDGLDHGHGLDHGCGLRNMRQVVESHGGSLTVHTESGWFVVRALIPVPER